MNCAELRNLNLIHAYTDGELDLVRSVEVEKHLTSCADCAAQKASIQSLRSALRQNNLTYRAPNSLRSKIHKIARTSGEKTQPREYLWIWKWLAAGATAFAVLSILLRPAGISEHDRILGELVSNHVRSLQANHLTDVASSDQHTVKPWFDGKTDFAPDVRDFAAQGFPLVGGRLDYLNGRTVAVLIYQYKKHFINVFVWPADKSEVSATENFRGYSIIEREVKGLRYCFVSDLNSIELTELARLISGQ